MNITLKGNPKSNQHIYKYACRGRISMMYMDKAGKDLKCDYIYQIRQQSCAEPITQEIELDVKLFFGTKRKVDVDNFGKLILDSMNGIIYEDDVLIKKISFEKFYDKENPRAEIIINKI